MKTRKQRAAELYDRLMRGPSSLEDHPELGEYYRLWATSWIIPELIALVPELRGRTAPTVSGRKQ